MKKLTVSEWFNRIGIFLLMFILVGVIPLPLMLTARGTIKMQLLGIVLYYLAYVVMIIFVTYCFRRDGQPHFKPFRLKNLWWVVGGYVIIMLASGILLQISDKVYHTATSKNQEAIQSIMGTNRTVMIAMVIGMVFLTPVLEETIFRGYLMGAFFKPDRLILPMIVSGAVFAIAHAQSNIFTFLVYMVIGMILAFVYRKTNNLKTSILLHALNNLVAAIGMITLLSH